MFGRKIPMLALLRCYWAEAKSAALEQAHLIFLALLAWAQPAVLRKEKCLLSMPDFFNFGNTLKISF